MKRILIVEDEENIADGIALNLEAEGYEVIIAADGQQALDYYHDSFFDLIILDIMIPLIDGLSVCRRIRAEGGRIPILFLTARDRQDDRVEGLLAGGDDYLTKPFNLQELLLRVAAVFRRLAWYSSGADQEACFEFDGNWIDFKSFTAKGVAGEIDLSRKECMIMKLLTEHKDKVVSRDMILDAVWGYNVYPSTRTIDNFIVRLRRLFEPDPTKPKFIHTIRGTGYKFTPKGE